MAEVNLMRNPTPISVVRGPDRAVDALLQVVSADFSFQPVAQDTNAHRVINSGTMISSTGIDASSP